MLSSGKKEQEDAVIRYEHLFLPINVGSLTLKNRISAAPVGRIQLLDDGTINPDSLEWNTQKAKGGCALVTIGESFVDFEYAHREPANYTIDYADTGDPCIAGYRALARAIKDNGAVVVAQLLHAGAVKIPQPGEKNPIGPVGHIRSDGVEVTEMGPALMEQVCERFAVCAAFMKAAGFDGVQLHAGHGWLFSQFLSPRTNTRRDGYGGSLDNRARFPMMIIDRVRRRCGPDFLIELRVSGDENVVGGMRVSETAAFCRMIEDKVDLIHVSAGIYHDPILSRQFSSPFERHCCNAELSAAIKKAVRIPVSVVGGVNDPDDAERVIAEGMADMVALGRQTFADPFFAVKAQEGRREDIDMCTRCLCCFGGPMEDQIAGALARGVEKKTPEAPQCTLNPYRGARAKMLERPAPGRYKNVLVIGGGLAGMSAAVMAARRGHRVTLAEKGARLGGKLNFADESVFHGDIKRLRDSYAARVEKSGARVLFNTGGGARLIEELQPDVVIAALGSVATMPDIPGVDGENVRLAIEAYGNPGACGERVVIVGGGLTGCDTGVCLAETGRTVTLLEKNGKLARDAYGMYRIALCDLLERKLRCFAGYACTEITQRGVTAVGPEGDTRFFEADTVVIAAGMTPLSRETAALRATAGGAEFYSAGDCVRPGKFFRAIHEGSDIALLL